MERLLKSALMAWKQLPVRKPVLLDGARQVGKTYLLGELFGAQEFANVHTFNFLTDTNLSTLFEGDLTPLHLISLLELNQNRTIDLTSDLIFFDEIGECQRALTCLKFFAEQLPQAYICASGSNIGLLGSFPVGKVHWLTLHTMTFEEFLIASGQTLLMQSFVRMDRSEPVHRKLWQCFKDYLYVGGMPEAVKAWWDDSVPLVTRVNQVRNIQSDLLSGYASDIGKFSSARDALNIQAVYESVPRQLAGTVNGTAGRYRFAKVVPKKKDYQGLSSYIHFLEKVKLVSRCHVISVSPVAPLSSDRKESAFKLYMHDVGLLGCMLELTYVMQQQQDYAYKGYLFENYVQIELMAGGADATYTWTTARAEIEFLISKSSGEIVPLEVKSSSNTQAKSLQSYKTRFNPAQTLKLIGGIGGLRPSSDIVVPVYYISKIAYLLGE